MTESDVDVIAPVISKLKGDSRLIVLLGSPEGIKNTSKKFRGLHGVRKIRRGLFVTEELSTNHIELLQSLSYISFAKTREIPSIRRKSDNLFMDRVYTLVSFSFKNPTAQQKKRVERLLRKTTGIRLRPGVILFPLLKSRERIRILGSVDERELLDSTGFSKKIRETGGVAVRWSRLRVDSNDGEQLVKRAIDQTYLRDIHALEENVRILREQSKDLTVSIRKLKTRYTVLSRRFRELKSKWTIAKKLWFYDSESSLKRTYNMLMNTRRAIEREELRRVG
jgi:hypothetical protein